MHRFVGLTHCLLQSLHERPFSWQFGEMLFDAFDGHPSRECAALVAAHAVRDDEELTPGVVCPTHPVLILVATAFFGKYRDLHFRVLISHGATTSRFVANWCMGEASAAVPNQRLLSLGLQKPHEIQKTRSGSIVLGVELALVHLAAFARQQTYHSSTAYR